MQEAFATALARWPSAGVPDNPRAWLVSAARHKAIDLLRRRARLQARRPELEALAQLEENSDVLDPPDNRGAHRGAASAPVRPAPPSRSPSTARAAVRAGSLEDQDRTRWDRAQIAEGVALAESALKDGGARPYALQAAIAALHAEAAQAGETDWPQIAALYGELARVHPSPVVSLNRAVAVGMAEGPLAGLRLLDGLDDALGGYHLLPAARAVP